MLKTKSRMPSAPITDEGRSGRPIVVDGDGGDVDPVAAQALEIACAEIIAPDTANDRTGLPELGNLIDEDGRRPRRERADEVQRVDETVAGFSGHDLDEDFADRDDKRERHLDSQLHSRAATATVRRAAAVGIVDFTHAVETALVD